MAVPTYISLFSGVGGLDLAVRIAVPDAQCVCYVEAEVPAAANLATRAAEGSLDDAPIWSDVRTFNGRAWRGLVDGVVAGFPCPDYSVAGRRAGIVGKHGQLWNSLCRVIGDVRPEWCFGVDFSRTDQLRSLGNLVQPLQGSAAFTVLLRRACPGEDSDV